MNPRLSLLLFELADYRYLLGLSVAAGLAGLVLSLASGYSLAEGFGVGVVVFFVALLALAWSVVVFVRRFKSWLGSPAVSLPFNYASEKAVARVIRSLADRGASYFDAGGRLGAKGIAGLTRVQGGGSVIVCRRPFVVASVGAGRVELFFDAADRDAATVAEVVKTRLSMG